MTSRDASARVRLREVTWTLFAPSPVGKMVRAHHPLSVCAVPVRPYTPRPPGGCRVTHTCRACLTGGVLDFASPTHPLTPAACSPPSSQPKEIQEIKDFLLTARRKDARCACPCDTPVAVLPSHCALR